MDLRGQTQVAFGSPGSGEEDKTGQGIPGLMDAEYPWNTHVICFYLSVKTLSGATQKQRRAMLHVLSGLQIFSSTEEKKSVLFTHEAGLRITWDKFLECMFWLKDIKDFGFYSIVNLFLI